MYISCVIYNGHGNIRNTKDIIHFRFWIKIWRTIRILAVHPWLFYIIDMNWSQRNEKNRAYIYQGTTRPSRQTDGLLDIVLLRPDVLKSFVGYNAFITRMLSSWPMLAVDDIAFVILHTHTHIVCVIYNIIYKHIGKRRNSEERRGLRFGIKDMLYVTSLVIQYVWGFTLYHAVAYTTPCLCSLFKRWMH